MNTFSYLAYLIYIDISPDSKFNGRQCLGAQSYTFECKKAVGYMRTSTPASKKLFILFFSYLLLSLSADVVAEQVIILNTTTKTPLHNVELDGFLDEITKHILYENHCKLETVELPAERGLVNANAGIVDGEMSRVGGIEKRYTNLIPVSEKMMDMEFVVYSKQAIDLSLGWDSLKDKTVAFINGWKILENNVPKSAEVTKVSNPEQLFNLLKNDRTDYVIYIRWSGDSLVKKMGLNDVNLRFPALAKKEMFMFLHKKHQKLIPGLSKSLIKMKKNGKYESLVNKHLRSL